MLLSLCLLVDVNRITNTMMLLVKVPQGVIFPKEIRYIIFLIRAKILFYLLYFVSDSSYSNIPMTPYELPDGQ